MTRILEGAAVWEPLGFRVTDFEAIRQDVPRQLLNLAREQKATSLTSSNPIDQHSSRSNSLSIECAEVLRSLCASLLVLPAAAPPHCPLLNVEEVTIADAVLHFRKGLAERLGPPILCAPTYPNWELAASCYALMLEAEFRGPVYLGTTRARNDLDLKLGIWNFSVDLSKSVLSWPEYLDFCKTKNWNRDRALAETPPGLLVFEVE